MRWERTATTGVPHVKRHPKSTQANPTLATDGQRIVALFGSEGLLAYDLEGRLLWKKDLGVLDSGFYRVPEAQWGFASSPVLHEGKVVVQADVRVAETTCVAASPWAIQHQVRFAPWARMMEAAKRLQPPRLEATSSATLAGAAAGFAVNREAQRLSDR